MRIKGCSSHCTYKCNKHINIKMTRFLTQIDMIKLKTFDYRIINILKMYEREIIQLGLLSIFVTASKRNFNFFFGKLYIFYK